MTKNNIPPPNLRDNNLILKNVLLVVDIQKEFKDNNGYYEKILDFIDNHYEKFDEVIAVYCDGKPTESTLGMRFRADENSLEFPYDRAISKSTYAVPLGELNKNDFYTIIGCESDACVLATVFAMYDAGYQFEILRDYIYSQNSKVHRKEIESIYNRNFTGLLI